MTRVLMEGSHAIAEAAIQAGCRFYAGYPIAPSTVQEAVDLVMLAFYLADKWRNPALVLGDFVLGHTSEAVEFRPRDEGDLPPKTWAATGKGSRASLNVTPLGSPEKLDLKPGDHYQAIAAKLPRIVAAETRAETGLLDDAEVAVVAFGSPARFVKYAVHACRAQGMKVGWVRPISLWPFPAETVAAAAGRVRALAVFEQNAGQMIDDVRLAALGTVPVVPIGGISHDPSGFGVGPALQPASIIAKITEVYRGKAAA